MTEGKSIQLISEEDLFEEIQTNLLELISDSDFVLEFKLRLISWLPSDRQKFINQIVEALKNNNQSVGTFMVSAEGHKMPPTVSNWLKDFEQSVGENFNQKKKEEYLNSPEFKKIELGPRTLLQNLFEFYELIKSFQKEPEKVEKMMVRDKKGNLHVMDRGELYDLEKKTSSLEKEKESDVAFTSDPVPDRFSADKKSTADKSISSKATVDPEEKKKIKPEEPYEKKKQEFPKEKATKIEEKPKKEESQPEAKKPEKPIASSYMYPEDEEEIRAQKDNLSSYSLPNMVTSNSVIKEIIEKNNINFSDDNLEKRFKSICISYFKGIRNERRTKDLLMRSTKVGGLNYSEDTAQNIIEILEKNKDKIDKIPHEEEKKEVKQKVPTPREALEKAMADKEVIKSKEDIKAEKPATEQKRPELKKSKNIKPKFKEEKRKKTKEEEKKEPILPKTELSPKTEKKKDIKVARPTSSVRGKRKIEDIKGKTKLLGPIDELKEMNLRDFSRLGSDKNSAAQKIYEKLNLLKEDSFSKYSKGVKAWRESEIYNLYLEMGRQSMENQKTIREIIEQRKKENQPYLSEQQFNEIVDLNKKLSFSL
ncbi:MAG: hypothetical protein U5L76_05740 [Patescibacteria group bacterium]|nr:hypothetical protein [Patescibacteria group bacterium]MDZ7799068.1 hypothetical protein [Patescibacteria group bacterium]